MLYYAVRRKFPQHTNLIVYHAGEQTERKMAHDATKSNVQAQSLDIYLDMVRNAYQARIAMETFVLSGGWATHRGVPLQLAPIKTATGRATRLAVKRATLGEALQKSDGTPGEPEFKWRGGGAPKRPNARSSPPPTRTTTCSPRSPHRFAARRRRRNWWLRPARRRSPRR